MNTPTWVKSEDARPHAVRLRFAAIGLEMSDPIRRIGFIPGQREDNELALQTMREVEHRLNVIPYGFSVEGGRVEARLDARRVRRVDSGGLIVIRQWRTLRGELPVNRLATALLGRRRVRMVVGRNYPKGPIPQ